MSPAEVRQFAVPRTACGAWRRLVAAAIELGQAVGRSFLRRPARGRSKLLVAASASLGDRRSVAVIEWERQRFLIGSSPSSITLLAQLERAELKGPGEPC